MIKSHSALLNTVVEQPATSATTVTPFISHEARGAEDRGRLALDDLMFLQAVTIRSGRMVRVVYRE